MKGDGDAITVHGMTGGSTEFRLAHFLYRSERSAMIWLVVRLWVGWQWLQAGWEKATGIGTANWFTHPDQLRGFIGGANYAWEHQEVTHGHPQVPYKWVLDGFNGMSSHALFFGRVVTIAELAVGTGLILGCLTGIAAAGGVALNFLYIAGGSAGTNGILMVLGILLILAWRVAGHYGLDRFLLTADGRSKARGMLTRRRPAAPADLQHRVKDAEPIR
ncbi:DoxX family protein [Nakamurella lactea]|uniref:DoxX family protein n=1 Tax=Nakamurella lactea TaxID=459515 RepID=UPI00041E1EDE|nr:DoxX family protein [Nakamurella lactea]